MVAELDAGKVYSYAGYPAYIELGTDAWGNRTVSVREVRSRQLLAHSTDLGEIAQRLAPYR